MQSLNRRLDPIKEEVIKAYQIGGYSECYDRGYFRDQMAFDKWLKGVRDNAATRKNQLVSYGGMQTLLDRTFEKFIQTIVDLKTRNQEQALEIQYLKAQLNMSEQRQAEKLLELADVCQ